MIKKILGGKTNTKTKCGKMGRVTDSKHGSYETAKQQEIGPTKSNPVPELTHDAIAKRAREIWQARGCLPGYDEQNWLEAEAQLKAELGIT